MSWKLYSKRHTTESTEPLQRDTLPLALRNQIIHILTATVGKWIKEIPLGSENMYHTNRWWTELHMRFLYEKGVLELGDASLNPRDQLFAFLTNSPTAETLDLIDFLFCQTYKIKLSADTFLLGLRQKLNLLSPDDAIAELNRRFLEHNIGYEFTSGEIVSIESTYIHSEAVRPAFQLLSNAGKGFSGPFQEFLGAHERYRKGEHKDAIIWALKAFESTLKAICVARSWPFDAHKDTSSKLLEIVFAEGLVPTYLQAQFTALRSVLESGVPTVRNKTSGHGQGPFPTDLPGHFASFVLHLTASNIVFLIESHKALP